jgi:hypothetical protein
MQECALYEIEKAHKGTSFAEELARACNDYSAKGVRGNPKRFGFFAALPMPLVEPSVCI